jgi:hypothetical protein
MRWNLSRFLRDLDITSVKSTIHNGNSNGISVYFTLHYVVFTQCRWHFWCTEMQPSGKKEAYDPATLPFLRNYLEPRMHAS